jgi:hypothetical protein
MYSPNGRFHNGFEVYTKRDSSQLLYWIPGAGGKWIIADAIGSGFRASEPNGASPSGMAGPGSKWLTWKEPSSQWALDGSFSVAGAVCLRFIR